VVWAVIVRWQRRSHDGTGFVPSLMAAHYGVAAALIAWTHVGHWEDWS